jgi:hypothetical protein
MEAPSRRPEGGRAPVREVGGDALLAFFTVFQAVPCVIGAARGEAAPLPSSSPLNGTRVAAWPAAKGFTRHLLWIANL